MSFLSPRFSRVTVGLAVFSAFAMAPMAAQAEDTPAAGTLTAGTLSNTAPAITAFTATLSGINQTVNTPVGAWSVTDATGSNAGYRVTVAATTPTVTGAVGASAGTGGSLTLTTQTPTAAPGNPALGAPVTQSSQVLGTTAATIANAAAGAGQGQWDYAADNGTTEKNLAVVIPGDASSGAYSSTLTYTTAPPVA
jgi:hypothetical protein